MGVNKEYVQFNNAQRFFLYKKFLNLTFEK